MYTPTYTKARATRTVPQSGQSKRFAGDSWRLERMETATYTCGSLDGLASGLTVYDTRGCTNGDVAPPLAADPPQLQPLVVDNVFRTTGRDVARPRCVGHGPYPGFGMSFPRLRAEP
jgi:hypothetical protein